MNSSLEGGALHRRLRREVRGEVRFDALMRGLYATDASIYQVQPLGVVIPRDAQDVEATLAACREASVPVLPRGGGTSQCGQTVGAAVVVDVSKHLREVVALDVAARRVRVQPGMVLDHLNQALKPHRLFFPVDPSTANRATLGGMAGNNSSGSRSIVYGNMVHNVHALEAVLADGTRARFGPGRGSVPDALADRVLSVARREAPEISSRFPKVLRRVGGYNLDQLLEPEPNLARLLVGSEGTLALFTELELLLQPLPKHRVLGVCHFPTFAAAMESTEPIVQLGPVAVELVDRTILDLSREMPEFAPIMARFVRGQPEALLLVEFSGDDPQALQEKLAELDGTMARLGFQGGNASVVDAGDQAKLWTVRSAGLNIVSSTRGDAKPISVIEDCAVPLKHLAAYTARLTRLFEKYGTRGTWYAHASVGCLHVRPVLNMKSDLDVRKLRSIAEEAFAIVREYGGSHSGEHGDGLVRSEFHAEMFGPRLVRAFEEVKDAFDPKGLYNPGKIVRPSRMDDRALFRYGPAYAPVPLQTGLDWSAEGGFAAATEMCNNNGACRKRDPGVMCPSFMVTQDEQHGVRGRANALRLALTGQLGAEALLSDGMAEAMSLCVSCKGCRRECPTGVDMAKMKIEVLYQRQLRRGLSIKDRLVAWLPRFAPWAQRFRFILHLRNRWPWLARVTERWSGFSARRRLPRWSSHPFRFEAEPRASVARDAPEVVLLVDTFTAWFDPEVARSALRVMERAGYRVHLPSTGRRPLCCGRTFLSAGLIAEARAEMSETLRTLQPLLERGVPIVGVEPSCLLTLRDELLSVLPGPESRRLATGAILFEEWVRREHAAGRFRLAIPTGEKRRALLHGHCHQKAFGLMPAVQETLKLIPDLALDVVESSCCGMAGTFGYQAATYAVSQAMAEQKLLPAVRKAPGEVLLVADGFSCRHQIHGGTGRAVMHVAELLDLASRPPPS